MDYSDVAIVLEDFLKWKKFPASKKKQMATTIQVTDNILVDVPSMYIDVQMVCSYFIFYLFVNVYFLYLLGLSAGELSEFPGLGKLGFYALPS